MKLTKSNRTRFIKRGISVTCFHCKNSIELGERIVLRGRHDSRRVYHFSCFESLYIDLPEVIV